MSRFPPLVAGVLLFAFQAFPRTFQNLSCGYEPESWKEQLHSHRLNRAAGKLRLRESIGSASANRDLGEVAILEDTGGVVARPNTFNLDQRTIRFRPVGAAYRFEGAGASYDAAAASSAAAITGIADDDTRAFAMPFPFAYFGVTYTRVFVNSDGNLTFEQGDASSDERSLGRLRSGPPRIAPLFSDLDPSRGGAIRVLAEPGRFVVSWVEVPEFRDFGAGPRQTFQVRLYPDGRIELAWNGVAIQSAVAGISPGRMRGTYDVVSLGEGSAKEFAGTVGERFGGSLSVDLVSAALQFYTTHDDAYDVLIFFNSLGITNRPGAVAYESTLRNNRTGIGDPLVDIGREYGSGRRLQAIINMQSLETYPIDPNGIVPLRASSRDTPLTILGHETGHLFLAYASVRDPSSPSARPMLSADRFHWNFYFNSDASLVEGNRIEDRGANVSPRFLTAAVTQGYSALDQYLMGLLPAGEVAPTFFVTDPSPMTFAGIPRPGVSFDGQRRDVEIKEIVEAEGRRVPDHTVAQRRFRIAFVLVVPQGGEPPASAVSRLDTYRREFEAAFSRYAGGRAIADTSLRQAVQVSIVPAAGVLSGGSATVTVRLERPADAPVTLLISTARGVVSAPSSVTVPAGASSATFTIRGLAQGVEEMGLTPGGSDSARFENVEARIQVASPQAVKLVSLSGSELSPGQLDEPVRIAVTDVNNLPYPGVRVAARASAGGILDATEVVTDELGIARFHWTPGPGAVNELTASITGGPALTITLIGRPVINALVNAASWKPQLSAGTIAVLFGSNLGETRVTVNRSETQLLYSSSRQVNFVIPPRLGSGPVEILATGRAGSSEPLRVNLDSVSPGIFYDGATGLGAIRFLTSRIAEVYGTGFGPVDQSALPRTVSIPTVVVAGETCDLLFSGMSPAITGLYQLNIRIPDTVPAGTQELSATIEGRRGNTVKIEVPSLF